jgi:uncharacterized membrane protein
MENAVSQEARNEFPSVTRGLAADAPLHWLRLGMRDFLENSGASIGYGAIVVVAGYLILGLTSGKPYLFLGAVSGFFLVAPLLAAGLYEISRRHERGESTSFASSFGVLRRNGQSLADFGFVLTFAMMCWQMLSALLFAFNFKGEFGDSMDFANSLFLSSDSLVFLIGYVALGGVIAAFVFAIAVVSVPMLVDREVDVVTAMVTSFTAVRANLAAMLVWAGLLVALTLVGFVTLMGGLAVIVPVLGHASWHAYKELVK